MIHKIGRYCQPTLSVDKNRLCFIEKEADFCLPIFVGRQNIGQHVGKPAVLSSGILLCDWSVCCLQRWSPCRRMWRSWN